MNIRPYVENFILQKINEGFDDEGSHDLKYYAFDWDDNLLFMPTSIILMDENEDDVLMSTEDFAEHRHKIGVEAFKYKNKKIIGYSSRAFKNFREEGDKKFIIDSMIAKPGPSWEDFVECINGGSIFAIITARGHNPKTIQEAVYNLIISNKHGINSNLLAKNLNKYKNIDNKNNNLNETKSLSLSDLNDYLNLCKFIPVSFKDPNISNPEQAKYQALKEFISYCKTMANMISNKTGKKENPMFKNDIEFNSEVEPFIGFSDDDLKNVEKIKELMKQGGDEFSINLYLTKGNKKIKY